MVLNFGDRTMRSLPDEEALMAALRAQNVDHGVYGFPDNAAAEQGDEMAYEALNAHYKQGPNGLLFVGRTGEDMMTGRELGLELASNVLAALLAAWIVSRFGPASTFLHRWLAVVLIGAAAWLMTDASFAIWYRFHWPFVRDELLGALLETAVAGAVIAAIVRPLPTQAPAAPATP